MFTCRENEMYRNAVIVSSIPELAWFNWRKLAVRTASLLCKTEVSEVFIILGCCTMYVGSCLMTFREQPKGQAVLGACKMGPNRLSQNVWQLLPTYTAQQPRRAKTSSTLAEAWNLAILRYVGHIKTRPTCLTCLLHRKIQQLAGLILLYLMGLSVISGYGAPYARLIVE